MSERIHDSSNRTNYVENDEALSFSAASTQNIDSVLDKIDAVLEKNAEEFVKGFIQKGGQ